MTSPGRVLLTGASGFVGRHLRPVLASAYPDAVLLTDSIDLRDEDAVAASVSAGRPDVCVHLAAIATATAAQDNEAHCWDVNLHGSLHLAHAILRHAPDCRLLFVSSADAYGGAAASGAPLDEHAPLAPRNVYAATKAAADLALGAMVGRRLRLVRLRPFNHTGPGQSSDLVIPAFARQIARIEAGLQRPLLKVGNLDTWRDFLDVRDVCASYAACIDRFDTLPSGGIVNIGSGRALRIGDVLAELLKLSGVHADVRAEASRMRANDVIRTVANPTRARAWLGWEPAVPWSRTLSDVLADWRARIAAAPDA